MSIGPFEISDKKEKKKKKTVLGRKFENDVLSI